MKTETDPNWCWFLVVDERGNVDESFNSIAGAEGWKEDHGGIIVKVKEVNE